MPWCVKGHYGIRSSEVDKRCGGTNSRIERAEEKV